MHKTRQAHRIFLFVHEDLVVTLRCPQVYDQYMGKCEEYSVKKDGALCDAALQTLSIARKFWATATIMKGFEDGLEGLRLRSQMQSAQRMFRDTGMTPSSLVFHVRKAYQDALSMK
jgi:hypothetical protein